MTPPTHPAMTSRSPRPETSTRPDRREARSNSESNNMRVKDVRGRRRVKTKWDEAWGDLNGDDRAIRPLRIAVPVQSGQYGMQDSSEDDNIRVKDIGNRERGVEAKWDDAYGGHSRVSEACGEEQRGEHTRPGKWRKGKDGSESDSIRMEDIGNGGREVEARGDYSHVRGAHGEEKRSERTVPRQPKWRKGKDNSESDSIRVEDIGERGRGVEVEWNDAHGDHNGASGTYGKEKRREGTGPRRSKWRKGKDSPEDDNIRVENIGEGGRGMDGPYDNYSCASGACGERKRREYTRPRQLGRSEGRDSLEGENTQTKNIGDGERGVKVEQDDPYGVYSCAGRACGEEKKGEHTGPRQLECRKGKDDRNTQWSDIGDMTKQKRGEEYPA